MVVDMVCFKLRTCTHPTTTLSFARPKPPPELHVPALFGRDAELEALAERLRVHRLVTLIGPGGVGKTSLAQETLAALRSHFADGATLIELAPLADPARVADAVAAALGIALAGRSQTEALATALAERAMRVVLDHAEHIVDAVGALLAALMPRAPAVQGLVTSQQRLRIGGEELFRLGALPLPLPPSHEQAAASGAVRLFAALAGWPR